MENGYPGWHQQSNAARAKFLSGFCATHPGRDCIMITLLDLHCRGAALRLGGLITLRKFSPRSRSFFNCDSISGKIFSIAPSPPAWKLSIAIRLMCHIAHAKENKKFVRYTSVPRIIIRATVHKPTPYNRHQKFSGRIFRKKPVIPQYWYKSKGPVSREIISFITDKYRSPVLHSSLISMKMDTGNRSNEASSMNAPTILVRRLTSLQTRSREW
jgi:hypothetical protein